METIKNTFIILLGIAIAYLIYLNIPYTIEERKSPYGNASIKTIIDSKRPFWIFYLTYEPLESHYKILYNNGYWNRLVSKEVEYCMNCEINRIIGVRWYRDSVNVTYETHFESNYDTFQKVYHFEQ